MSLSWSPTYCLTHSSDQTQCGGTKGYGFVLHGLWPQYAHGGYPQDCATPQHLTAEAVSYGEKVFPSPKLISHEWSRHGTCSGMSALDYFKTADQALVSVHVPSEFDAPRKTLQMSAPDILQAFTKANPGMETNALSANCSGPELSEVRVCLSKDLKPQACGRDVKSNCLPGPIRIPSVR
jgi:ribonuclease T2